MCEKVKTAVWETHTSTESQFVIVSLRTQIQLFDVLVKVWDANVSCLSQYGRVLSVMESPKFSAFARDFKEMCGKRSKITAPRIQNRDSHKPEYLYYICGKKNQSRLLSSKIIIITSHNHCTIHVAMWELYNGSY